MRQGPYSTIICDVTCVETLADHAFQVSEKEIDKYTFLCVPRLAHLWEFCRMSNPEGAIIEIGVCYGGGALHLSNSCPTRKLYACDTFAGFQDIPKSPGLDRCGNNIGLLQEAQQLFDGKNRDVVWIVGRFPQSAAGVEIQPLSFAHVDVNLYVSTAETLDRLAGHMLDRSLIAVDDYRRQGFEGVEKAIHEFEQNHPDWKSFPLFPTQGLLIHRSWFDRG